MEAQKKNLTNLQIFKLKYNKIVAIYKRKTFGGHLTHEITIWERSMSTKYLRVKRKSWGEVDMLHDAKDESGFGNFSHNYFIKRLYYFNRFKQLKIVTLASMSKVQTTR